MSCEKHRIATVVALTLVTVIGAVLSVQMDRAGTPTGTSASAVETTPASPATDTGEQVDSVETAAACRVRPECSTNSDCDERCGVGLGKCVHSNCPVRVCRCT